MGRVERKFDGVLLREILTEASVCTPSDRTYIDMLVSPACCEHVPAHVSHDSCSDSSIF